MEIKDFIESIDNFSKLNNKEQIPYFAYFLISIKEYNGITQSDIRECYSKTKVHLSINLSIYFKNHTKKKNKQNPLFIRRTENRKQKYYLEKRKTEEIEKKLKVKNKPKKSIITSKLNNKFFDGLIGEINKSYYYEIYTGCFILTRKLFENLLIDILRNNFKKEKTLYQDKNNKKKYNDFSILLNNLKKKKSDLGFTTNEVEGVIQKLDKYRIEANSKTHSIIDLGNKEDLEKYEIETTFDLLKRVWDVN